MEKIENVEILTGRNAIIEALKSNREINRLLILQTAKGVENIVTEARNKKIPIDFVSKDKLDRISNKSQGIIAYVSPIKYSTLDDVFQRAEENHELPFVLILDELEDPHNVGALIRTADAAGIHGVLIPRRHSVQISSTVAKSSAGAIEHVPIARIGNLRDTLVELKNRGLWIIGADMDGEKFYDEVDLKIPLAIVIGNEGHGLRRLTRENCDIIVKIPMRGKINSLNASVAGALLMYESLRQKIRG